jgi:hypothetical protein
VGSGHLALLFVVARQAKGIAKGHQRLFGGIGFGFLKGRFMGQALIHGDAMAGAGALADHAALTGGDGDAHPGDVAHAPA